MEYSSNFHNTKVEGWIFGTRQINIEDEDDRLNVLPRVEEHYTYMYMYMYMAHETEKII